jgi:hypothetical protein
MPDRDPMNVKPVVGHECQWCGATVMEDPVSAKKNRRRWVATIAAALSLLLSQIAQLAMGGETIVEMASEQLD